MQFDPNPGMETYFRLSRLVEDLDRVIFQHTREHGGKMGANDAFNAVCAVLSGVVQSAAEYDRDVFDKLSGAIAYHIYCQASAFGDRGEYKFQ